MQKELIEQSQLDQVDAKIQDPNADKLTKAYWKHVKEAWREKNAHINNLIEIEESRHTLALETIYTKAESKRLQDIQADFDREAMLRQAAHNTELARIGKSRKEIEDEFNKQYFADGVSEAEQKRLKQQLATDLAALSHREKAKQDLQDKFNQEEYDNLIAHLKNLLAAKEEIFADRNSKIEFELLTDAEKKAVEDDFLSADLAVVVRQSLGDAHGSVWVHPLKVCVITVVLHCRLIKATRLESE
ncbi:hypothetical protein ACLI09_09540 [Flavobacterium sp. RHBU_24]|uniref:hypothetical protein n=1 Tax=Flavobacterium sp. RHBU_24 TaxID=3391185 RepID=UPI003984F344